MSFREAKLYESRMGGRLVHSPCPFWTVWLQHKDYLYFFCLKLTHKNHAEASDLLGKARDRAQMKWPQHAHKITNAKSWLSSLTRNLYLDLCRARSRQHKLESNLQKEAWGEIVRRPSPESQLLDQELRAYLQQLIITLPPKLREPFILRCRQEKSYREVALQLGLSEAAVRKRVQKARQHLRKPLRQYLAGNSKATVLEDLSQSEMSDVDGNGVAPVEEVHHAALSVRPKPVVQEMVA